MILQVKVPIKITIPVRVKTAASLKVFCCNLLKLNTRIRK